MRSEAATVDQYLAELPEDRRCAIEAVRDVVLRNLPIGYEEVMNWGMMTYQVPLEVFPDTYNGQPLMYAAVASQKHHMAVYLTAIYMDEDNRASFLDEYRSTGKRMDLGKSCVRFRDLGDLPLDLIGKAISLMSVEEFVEKTKQLQANRRKR